MNNKILVSTLLIVLLIAGIPLAFAHNQDLTANPNIWGAPDPSTLVIDTIGEPESLDPAWIYDTASAEVAFNVYDTLMFFSKNYQVSGGLYQAGQTSEFVPVLAKSWKSEVINQVSPEGLTWVKRITFEIRLTFTNTSGTFPVKFSNGGTLTTEDVEYSFERWMVQDRDGGPLWMYMIWMLGDYYAYDPVTEPDFGKMIDHAVQRNATHVWMNMVLPAPDKTFFQILGQSWSGIVNKAWVQSHNGLNITKVQNGWANWTYIYDTWHNPSISEIEDVMMGTGPYKLVVWNKGTSYSVERFPGYWGGWPSPKKYGSTERLPSYISTVVWNLLPDFATRRPRFIAGTTDMTSVDRQYRDQVLGQPGVRGWYGVSPPENLLVLSATGGFFTFDINTAGGTNPYAPSWLSPGTFSTAGIPPNIFNDANVRKGFAFAFDYDGWLSAAYLGEGEHPADPIIPGLSYDNVAQEAPTYNTTKATYYLKLAWGGVDSRSGVAGVPVKPEDPSKVTAGNLWTGGMKFRIVYNTGNVARQTAAEMFTNQVNGLGNANFQLQPPLAVPWGSQLLPDIIQLKVPIFMIGWLADYPDPDNFAFPFMHSLGTFSQWQGYSNAHVDALIEQGAQTADDVAAYAGQLDQPDPRPFMNNNPGTNIPGDTRWPRRSIYYELQAIYAIDDIPSVTLVTAAGRHWERDWVRGWYYNAIYPGQYIYDIWKAETHLCDANDDGLVDVGDLGVISAHWGGPPAGSLGYAVFSDLAGGSGATTGSLSGPTKADGSPHGIPDGVVNIIDVSIVNAFYDGPPVGTLHP
jgi:peptide/nickel transport system substrate-binding protein